MLSKRMEESKYCANSQKRRQAVNSELETRIITTYMRENL